MMLKSGLNLEINDSMMDTFDGMEDTYRKEGLTVGAEYMRIGGAQFCVRLKCIELHRIITIKTFNFVFLTDGSSFF